MGIKNFFKFLEGKGKEIPFKIKIGFFPEELSPEELNVTGDLDLSWTPIKTLPKGLNVTGNLDLSNCEALVSLPEGLNVTGSLDLSELPIKTLPEGLTVGGNLELFGCTSLVSLPEGLNVGGNLYISKKLLDKYGGEDGVRKFIEDNGGYVKKRIVW